MHKPGSLILNSVTELQERYEQVDELWRSRMDNLRQLLANRELFQADIERCLRWLKEADVITFPGVNPASSYEELQSQIDRYQVCFVFLLVSLKNLLRNCPLCSHLTMN